MEKTQEKVFVHFFKQEEENIVRKTVKKGSMEEALNLVLRLKNDTTVVGEVEVSHDFQFKIK